VALGLRVLGRQENRSCRWCSTSDRTVNFRCEVVFALAGLMTGAQADNKIVIKDAPPIFSSRDFFETTNR
jgi:hypothetical protein